MSFISCKTRFALMAAISVAGLSLGCSSTTMGTDSGGNQMGSGIATARSGLSKAQFGVDAITAGSRQTGMGSVSDGIGMMRQGVSDIHQGMGMMSGGMMMNCADGGSDTIVTPMQEAMNEMQQGHSMMGVDAGASDEQGLTQLRDGMAKMQTCLDRAQSSMNCMGHGGMMSGGMM